jgi:radical SAM-linked protein
MCREPQIGAPGVKPRVNLAVPQWQAAQATEPEEQAIQDNSQRREELGYKAGHYRVWFSKTGPAAFLSQLELQNVLERSLRRSGLKPAFSSGFHPMPLVAFGWALPVGVESLAEWFALFLREPSPPAELARRLGQAMPEGLNVLGAEELGMGRKVEQPKAEEFRLRFLEGEPDPAGRMAQWQELLGRENYPWVSATKRGTRSLNLRPLVQAMEQRGPAEVVLTFSWANNQYLSPLKLVMAINQGLSQQDFLLTKLRQIF